MVERTAENSPDRRAMRIDIDTRRRGSSSGSGAGVPRLTGRHIAAFGGRPCRWSAGGSKTRVIQSELWALFA